MTRKNFHEPDKIEWWVSGPARGRCPDISAAATYVKKVAPGRPGGQTYSAAKGLCRVAHGYLRSRAGAQASLRPSSGELRRVRNRERNFRRTSSGRRLFYHQGFSPGTNSGAGRYLRQRPGGRNVDHASGGAGGYARGSFVRA